MVESRTDFIDVEKTIINKRCNYNRYLFYLQLPLSVDAYWNSPVINVDFDDSSCINTNEAVNVTSRLVVICNDGYINDGKSSDLV